MPLFINITIQIVQSTIKFKMIQYLINPILHLRKLIYISVLLSSLSSSLPSSSSSSTLSSSSSSSSSSSPASSSSSSSPSSFYSSSSLPQLPPPLMSTFNFQWITVVAIVQYNACACQWFVICVVLLQVSSELTDTSFVTAHVKDMVTCAKEPVHVCREWLDIQLGGICVNSCQCTELLHHGYWHSVTTIISMQMHCLHSLP